MNNNDSSPDYDVRITKPRLSFSAAGSKCWNYWKFFSARRTGRVTVVQTTILAEAKKSWNNNRTYRLWTAGDVAELLYIHIRTDVRGWVLFLRPICIGLAANWWWKMICKRSEQHLKLRCFRILKKERNRMNENSIPNEVALVAIPDGLPQTNTSFDELKVGMKMAPGGSSNLNYWCFSFRELRDWKVYLVPASVTWTLEFTPHSFCGMSASNSGPQYFRHSTPLEIL